MTDSQHVTDQEQDQAMSDVDFKSGENSRVSARVGSGLPGPGRPAGLPNRLTTAFREAVRAVYEDIGGNEAFAKWARGRTRASERSARCWTRTG